jgi:hypothetical protein
MGKKRFDIHEWQAKQHLFEEDKELTTTDNDWKGLDAEVAKYIGLTFATWMSPSHPVFSKEYAKAPYFDKFVEGIMKIVDNYEGEELDEANMTGTGASFNAGAGEGYATPNAFGDNKEKKMQAYTSIGYKPINEQEDIELSNDAERVKSHLNKINTRKEWEEVMQIMLNISADIPTVSTSVIKTFLLNAIKNIKDLKNLQN